MRYFFHYADSSRRLRDPEGGEFFDIPTAREHARVSARELLALDHGEPDPTYAGGRFDISDADGNVLAVIVFEEDQLN
jgi:hypothetical protein